MFKDTKYCIRCNSQKVKVTENKIICEDCGYSFSLHLFNNTYLRKVASEYTSKVLTEIMTVWMSVLLIELSISATLQTSLNSIRDKKFVDQFISNNYRISFSKKLILLFIKYPVKIKKRINAMDIESILDRDHFDKSFTELESSLFIEEDFESYLSNLDGYSHLDFNKEFTTLKNIRHQFRRGESLDKIDIDSCKNLTYDYLTRLSSIVDNIIEV